MAYVWNPSLETGYDKIDNQHKQLIAAVNNLVEASKSGRGNNAVMETLDFLTGYTVKHFADEEQLQCDYEYPDYFNHKLLHDQFKIQVGEMTAQVVKYGPTAEIIYTVSAAVGSWLLNHIRGDDFKMAAFVKAADAKVLAGNE